MLLLIQSELLSVNDINMDLCFCRRLITCRQSALLLVDFLHRGISGGYV